MADTKPEAPETTPIKDWIVPNQDKIERVLDARLAAHAEFEKKPKTSNRSSAGKADDK